MRHGSTAAVWAEDKRLFVTWHLYGSLPQALYPPPNKQNAGQAFAWMDRYLDSARGGPLYLKQQPIAQAFVVMANHVHLLVLPRVSPSRFLQTLKGYTAREANRLLRRTGQPFWQAESYDDAVRDERNRTASKVTLRIIP